jgi:septal ring factor EnvC (AmiA/AmiB activator)
MKLSYLKLYRISVEGAFTPVQEKSIYNVETKKESPWSGLIKKFREKLTHKKPETKLASNIEILKAEIEKLDYQAEILQMEINNNEDPNEDERLDNEMNDIFNQLGIRRQKIADINRSKLNALKNMAEHSDIIFLGVVILLDVFFLFLR